MRKCEKQLWNAAKNADLIAVETMLKDPNIEVNCSDQYGFTPLFIACDNAHIDVVQCLLSDPRTKVNQPNTHGLTPLHLVCLRSTSSNNSAYAQIAYLLMCDSRININQASIKHGETPLILAAMQGATKIVEYLLMHEFIDVNRVAKDGTTPLIAACRSGQVDVVQQLLNDRRTKVNQAAENGETPFLAAYGNYKSYDRDQGAKVLQCLLADRRVKVSISQPVNQNAPVILIFACRWGHVELVHKLLLYMKIDVNQPVKLDDSAHPPVTPLIAACREGNTDVVQYLLANEPIEVNQVVGCGQTAFNTACYRGHVEIVQQLLSDSRTDVSQSEYCFECLIELGNLHNPEEVDVTKLKHTGKTPLYIACEVGNIEVVRSLLADQRFKSQLNLSIGHDGLITPFHAACENGHVSVVKYLLSYRSLEVNKTRGRDKTPFFDACWNGHLKVVQLLLQDRRTNVNLGSSAVSPLHCAITPSVSYKSHEHILVLKHLLSDRRVEISRLCYEEAKKSPKILALLEQAIAKRKEENTLKKRRPTRKEKPAVSRPPEFLSLGKYTIRYGDLKLGDRIGEGSYGMVYKGVLSTKIVAIKRLKYQGFTVQAKKEFENEIKIMSNLHHSNVVRLYGAYLQPYAIVMEFMSGGSLYQRLHDGRPLDWVSRIRIGFNISAGLNYLHKNKILHRDLKSPNILLDQNGCAKIADFGLSKVKMVSRSLTTGPVRGSLLWMAPELLNGKKSTYACDIYALGVVLWEIATRSLPFQNTGGQDKLIALWVSQGRREAIPRGTPTKFKTLIEQCWAQTACRRPRAELVYEELEKYHYQTVEQGITSTPISRTQVNQNRYFTAPTKIGNKLKDPNFTPNAATTTTTAYYTSPSRTTLRSRKNNNNRSSVRRVTRGTDRNESNPRRSNSVSNTCCKMGLFVVTYPLKLAP